MDNSDSCHHQKHCAAGIDDLSLQATVSNPSLMAASDNPDVHIFDENNKLINSFNSEHRTTVQDVFDTIGNCVLKQGATTIASKAWALAPGSYVAYPKRPRFHETQQPPLLQNDEYRRLRKEVDELKGQESFAVSYADYFNEKSAAGRVTSWALPVVSNAISHLPACLQNSENLDKGGEKEKVKPCWEKLIRENDLLPGLKTAYEVGYLGSKIPDIAFFPTNVVKPNAGEFVAYGDCKGSSWSGTSASEMGQAMQYGHRILDAQPLRTHVYGFFTNNEHTMLIKTFRTGARPYTVNWQISGVMRFDQGMATFFNLLGRDSGFMLPPTVNGKLVSIKSALRPGRTCRAFLSMFDGEEVVAKLFHNDLQVQDNRQKLLDAKAAVDPHNAATTKTVALVPTVQGSEGVWLIITPYGTPFTPVLLKMNHVRMLVATLQAVHGAGIVHRDVRFSNIFLLEDGSVLLNDWGSSARIGVLQEVAGCPDQWRHPELRGVTECAPQPKHDLYSLVVSIGNLVAPGTKDTFRNSVFDKAIVAANMCNYEGVAKALAEIIRD